MNIGIDIDQTLTNLDEFIIAYGQFFDYQNNLNKLTDIYGDSTRSKFNWGEQIDTEFWHKYVFEINNQIQPRPLAKQVIDMLIKDGHKIYFVSSRAPNYWINPYKVTYKWLKKYKIKFEKLIVNQKNKLAVCKQYNIEMFLDDREQHVESLFKNGIKCFLFDNFYNKNFNNPDIPRVYSFPDFYIKVKKLNNIS